MMKQRLTRWLSAGLMVGSIGCSDGSDPANTSDDQDPVDAPPSVTPKPADPGGDTTKPPAAKPPVSTVTPGDPEIPVSTVLASLSAAADCGDLLTRVQDDAIAKLMMQVKLYKDAPPTQYVPGRPIQGGALDAGVALPTPSVAADDAFGSPTTAAPSTPPSAGGLNAGGGSTGTGGKAESAADGDATSGPVGASDTNTQVAGVDEADFVKVVEKGASIYLLHGNTLRKLDSWPAASTKLVGEPLTIEGSPSEMFVTDAGKAVIFSSVVSYQSTGGKPIYPGVPVADVCAPGYCGGGYGTQSLKITVADVSADKPKVEREIYYEGSYVSSRRYNDVVRAVIQSYSKFGGLYTPQIQWYDAWGRPYEAAEIASQLDEWEKRTEASIRKTELKDWFPVAQQVVDGKLVDIEPGCDSYFVPDPGLADYGLTHVLSLDLSSAKSPIGGVTVVGAVSTVYSNADKLVLAQPDYRWSPASDFGVVNTQQTAFHVFALAGATTTYTASGWLFGALPSHNPQFGIDVAADGTLRVASTGWVRDKPNAKPDSNEFWSQHTENYVLSAQIAGGKVTELAKSPKLGKEGESVQSARFVGDRAYVVTYRQIDPLIVLDVATSTPKVLGEIEIPGFAQYMHPLDSTHLITVGQGADRGIQLQLFDVTDPKNLPEPRRLDFGAYSSSEVSYNHKAFTTFEGGLLAMPLYGQYLSTNRYNYKSTLEVIRASASNGFSKLASIDHSKLYADNGLGVSCGKCDAFSDVCYEYTCGYQPEVRRGHFVKGEDGKIYVYSFSYAGVLVSELGPPTRDVASVGLPQPVFDAQPWHDGGPIVVTDGGVATPPPTSTTDPVKPTSVAASP
jgi:Beta propeller domain